MLYNIPDIISPELLKILMEMGHGDDLVIGDANFPAASHAQRLINCNGHAIPPLLEAILGLFPLDTFVEKPVFLMDGTIGDNQKPPVWSEYEKIIKSSFDSFSDFEYVEREMFYQMAKKSYAIVTTSEKAWYGCIIIKKGAM